MGKVNVFFFILLLLLGYQRRVFLEQTQLNRLGFNSFLILSDLCTPTIILAMPEIQASVSTVSSLDSHLRQGVVQNLNPHQRQESSLKRGIHGHVGESPRFAEKVLMIPSLLELAILDLKLRSLGGRSGRVGSRTHGTIL